MTDQASPGAVVARMVLKWLAIYVGAYILPATIVSMAHAHSVEMPMRIVLQLGVEFFVGLGVANRIAVAKVKYALIAGLILGLILTSIHTVIPSLLLSKEDFNKYTLSGMILLALYLVLLVGCAGFGGWLAKGKRSGDCSTEA